MTPVSFTTAGFPSTSPTKISRRRLVKGIGALVGVTAVFAVTACGSPPSPAPAPTSGSENANAPGATKPAATAKAATGGAPAATAPASGEKVTLSWWNNQPMARTKGLWDAVVKDIEDAYPNLTIKTLIIPFDDFEPKVMTGLAAKSIGDIVDVHPIHAFTFAMRGALVNLNDYMKDIGFPESDFTTAWKYNQWHGKYWAIPRSDNPTVILYNKKMVTDAGLPDPFDLYQQGKWDVAAWDKMMTTLSKGDGAKRVFGAAAPSTSLRSECMWIWGEGGDVWNADETETLIADPTALKAWDYLDSYYKNKWCPSPAESNIPGGSVALMGSRRVVADWPGAQFVLGGQAQYLPEAVQKEMHLVAMNKFWNGKQEIRDATNSQGTYPGTKYRDEAWKASAFTLSEKVQTRIISARWTAPLRKSWLKSDMWVKSLNPDFEDAQMWEDTVNNIRYFAHLPRFVDIDKIQVTAFQAAVLNQKTVKEAMTDAAAQINQILKDVATEVNNSPYLK